MQDYMPQDLLAVPEELLAEPNSSSKLPLRPKSRPEKWDHAKSAALNDKDNWRKWDTLFKAIDDAWATSPSKEAANSAHQASKAALTMFLKRFPYSAQHWRQFSLAQYKMGGVDDSVAVLKDATVAYPQSVSLWVEYLTALMTVETKNIGPMSGGNDAKSEPNGAETQGKQEQGMGAVTKPELAEKVAPSAANGGDSSENVQNARTVLLRAEFARAADAIGLNFNADPFWNKYLEFEASISPKSPSLQLLRVYLRLIRIPLYQYAQYYSQFAEISKSFKISEILSPDELPRYLQVFGKSSPEELSVVEQHQLIDTFSYDIFTNTQAQVTRKWPFEAALTFQEFSLADLDSIKKQTGEWIKYLDAENDLYVSLTDEKGRNMQYELIVSLFERALVPNCGNNKLWLRCIAFLKNYAPSAEISFAARNDLYRKAIFTFLPVTSSQIRKDYVSMLATEKSFDAANDFLLETVRLFSGITEARLYVKSGYLSGLTQVFELWASHLPAMEVATALELLVTSHFDRVDRYKKDTKSGSKDAQVEQGTPRLKSHHTNGVSKYLNDDGICIAAVHLLKSLQKAPENTSQIRKFYNKFHAEQAFSRSVQFWRFFVESEGYEHRNLVNLRNVIEYIKTSTALPKLAVDAFLDIYYEITCANLAHAKLLSGKENYLDILVTINAEKSDDLFVNKSARARLAKHNYLLSDSKPGPNLPREDALMKMRLNHLPHPGVPIEQKPDLRTRLMDGEWISLLDDDIEPPLLPTFKHLEMANAPISYPEE
ncbi:hypothetical protein OXX79_008674 [Metschnikowia pulcherrima]